MKKRILALILVLLMLVPLAVACKKDKGGNDGEGGTIAPPVAEWELLKDDVPADLKFEGETFTILFREEEPYRQEFGVEEDSEVVLEHATFQRNYMLKERFGIELDLQSMQGHYPNAATMTKKINENVLAGAGEWDACAGYAIGFAGEALKKSFVNLHDVEYLDLTKGYWNQSAVEEFTINGNLFFATGDISPMLIGQSVVMYENLKVAADWQIPSCYELVKNDFWTQDVFLALCKQVNDSEAVSDPKLGRTFGLLFPLNAQVDAYYASWDIETTRVNDDGELEVVMDKDKLIQVDKLLFKMMVETPQVYPCGGASDGIGEPYSDDEASNIVESFERNEALFTPNRLYITTTLLTDMEEDYAILPYPKMNKDQENYQTYSWDQYSTVVIPKDAPDKSFAGAVLEVMACYSQNYVTPAYYETALKKRYAPNEESSQMLDYITENIIIEVSYLHGATNITYFLRNNVVKPAINNGMSNIGHGYDSVSKNWKTGVQNVMDSYAKVQ